MPLGAKRRKEPDASLFSCVSHAQFLRQEFFRLNMLHRTHRAAPEAAKRANAEPATHRQKLASQDTKICVADSLDSTTSIARTARDPNTAYSLPTNPNRP